MRGYFALGLTASLLALGCQHSANSLPKQPRVEEFNLPPDETRYNTPPESKYVKPTKSVDQASKLGPGGSGGAGSIPGGPGSAGPGR